MLKIRLIAAQDENSGRALVHIYNNLDNHPVLRGAVAEPIRDCMKKASVLVGVYSAWVKLSSRTEKRQSCSAPRRCLGYRHFSAAATVPRRRVLLLPVCPGPVPRRSIIVEHLSAAATKLRRRSIVVTGLPPPPCRATSYFHRVPSAVTVHVVWSTAALRALLVIPVLSLLPPLNFFVNPCCLATLVGWNTPTFTFCLHLRWYCRLRVSRVYDGC